MDDMEKRALLAVGLSLLLLFQTTPQDPKTLRKVPMLQRLGEVQSTRFPLQKGQIMHRIVLDVLLAPVSRVPGNQPIREDQPDLVHTGHDRDLAVGVGRRHRVIVVVETDQGEGTGPARRDPPRFERLPGKRQQKRG